MTPSGRDAAEIEALVTDSYLDALLAAHERHATDAPADPALDPVIRDAATRLARDLVRVHPSFRFEERLAMRLAAAARSMGLAAAAGGSTAGGGVAPLPIASLGGRPGARSTESDDDPFGDLLDDALDAPGRRPLLLGGALASTALSIAGVAWVAWRRTRPPARAVSPMARAVRAARAARQTRLIRRLD